MQQPPVAAAQDVLCCAVLCCEDAQGLPRVQCFGQGFCPCALVLVCVLLMVQPDGVIVQASFVTCVWVIQMSHL